MIGNSNSIKKISIMIFITAVIQILTILKTSQLAGIFGVGLQMDSYNFANNIAGFIIGFVASGIVTVLIPAYVTKVNKYSINTFLTTIYGIVLVISGLVFLFRNQIIRLLTNRSEEFIYITSKLLPILILYNFIISTLSVTTAFFQCKGKFYIEKILLLIVNFSMVFTLLFVKELTIIKYSIILLGLAFVNLVVQYIIAYKKGFEFYPQLEVKENEFKKLIKVFIPTIFSSGLYKISLLTDSIIATNLEAGKLSLLNYSTQLMTMINTLLISNILIYLYPIVVKEIKETNFQDKFFNMCIGIFCLMCFMATGFILAGKEVLVVLFEHGEFNSDLTIELYYCSLIYILGQPINVVRDLIYRFFYANGDTKSTFKNSIMISIFNIVVSIILSTMIGVYGVVLGTLISAVLSLMMIIVKFRNKFTFKFNVRKVVIEFAKCILAMLLVIILGLTVKNLIIIKNNLISIGVYGVYTIIAFTFFLFIVKSNVFKIIIKNN